MGILQLWSQVVGETAGHSAWYEEYGSGDCGGALERELFSHSMRPLAKSKLLSRLFLALVAKAPQISYPLLMNGKSPGELGDEGIPICIFAAVHLDEGLKDSAANRCTIPRRAWVCHMLLKGNMKWNINDFQRLESKQSGWEHCFWSSIVHIVAWLVTAWPLPAYLTSLILRVLNKKMKIIS